MKQLKPMGHAQTEFIKAYKRSKFSKQWVDAQRETKQFVTMLHKLADTEKNNDWYEVYSDIRGAEFEHSIDILTHFPGCEGLFVALSEGRKFAWVLDTDGAILASTFDEKGQSGYGPVNSDLAEALIADLAQQVAQNPELIKRLPSAIIPTATYFGVDFKQTVLTTYVARFEEYIEKSKVDADTDFTKATESAQGELKMLKETFVEMEKAQQAKQETEQKDKKTIADKKNDAISSLKTGLNSEDEDPEA